MSNTALSSSDARVITIDASARNDTLTGKENGTNVYAFDSVDGANVITNYSVGDTIKIMSGALSAVTTVKNSDDILMTIGKTKVTVKDASTKKVTVVDKDGNVSTQVYGTATREIDDNSGNLINISTQANVATIDASARTTDVELIGNAAHNKIITSTGTSVGNTTTITGGKGNDTITFTPGNNNNLIVTDYTVGQDIIQLSGGASVSAASLDANGSDVTLTISKNSNAGTITIKNAVVTKNGKTTYNKITIADEDGNKTAMAYGTDSIDVANADGATIDVTNFSAIKTINANARGTNLTLVANTANNYTITGGKKDDVIYTGGGANVINAGAGNDTIYSGAGADTITGSGGKDYFVYGGGDDVITDYATAQDVIKFTDSTTVSSYAIDGKDLILSVSGGGKIRLQNVITTNARTGAVTGKKITVEDKDGNAISQVYGASELTVINADVADGKALDLSQQPNDTISNVTAASRSYAISINGNGKDNKLVGGKGADTLSGGVGDDTLVGGSGNDVFVYDGSGADVITDYSVARNNSDVIKIAATISDYDYRIVGKDVIIYETGVSSETNTLKVVNGKDKALQIVDANGAAATVGTPSGGVYNDYTEVILPTTGSNVYTASSDARVITIDASARNGKNPVDITGNANANVIVGSAGADVINGGGGADTIKSGGGKDTITYAGGQIVITDYAAGQDVINIGDESISGVAADGADAIFTLSSSADSTITIKNAFTVNKKTGVQTAAKKITFSNGTTSTSQVYGYPVMTVVNADVAANARIDLNDAANEAITTVNAKGLATTLPVEIVGHSAGGNVLQGGGGDDTLVGGSGNDTLTGNKGIDFFVYNGGADVITDYSSTAASGDVVTLAGGLKVSATEYTRGSNGKPTSDVKLTINNSSGVAGSIVLSKAKNKIVTVANDEGETRLVYGDKSATQIVTDSAKVTAGGIVNVLSGASNKASVAVDLVASDESDTTLIGGAGADTLSGGAKADYITGGAGNDTFVVGEGLDTISDYTAGQDVIDIGSAKITGSTISGANVLLTVGGSSSDVITILKGKNKKLTVKDANGTTSLVYGDGEATMAFAAADIATEFDATNYELVKLINGAAANATKALTLKANATGNTLKGGKGADTLTGGAGNDYLTGGGGADTFVYSGGADTITDYAAGQDVINLGGGSVTKSAIVANAKNKQTDIQLNIGEGNTIRVANGVGKRITVGETTLIYGNGDATMNVINTDSASINAGSGGNVELPEFAKTIDATKRTIAVEIVGNATTTLINGGSNADTLTGGSGSATINGGAGADVITGGSVSTTINGGKGNDILIGGAGADYFYYTNGDGNDVIKGFDANSDYIVLGAKTALNTSKTKFDANNTDYTLVIGSGSIKLQNISSGTTIKVYESPTSSSPIEIKTSSSDDSGRVAGFEEELNDELFADENYVGSASSELDEIIKTNTSNPVSTDKLYNTGVDAASITQVSASVLNRSTKK